jgi:hypothetical protein
MSLSNYQDVAMLGFGRMFIIELDGSQYMNGNTKMFWGMKLNILFLMFAEDVWFLRRKRII